LSKPQAALVTAITFIAIVAFVAVVTSIPIMGNPL
jgi:hypothetical protein